MELGRDRVAGSLDVLLWAAREGRLSVADAESLLSELDVGEMLVDGLRRSERSFADLVSD